MYEMKIKLSLIYCSPFISIFKSSICIHNNTEICRLLRTAKVKTSACRIQITSFIWVTFTWLCLISHLKEKKAIVIILKKVAVHIP